MQKQICTCRKYENQLEFGKYAENKANDDGNLLTEFCELHNLFIRNTIDCFFYHVIYAF